VRHPQHRNRDTLDVDVITFDHISDRTGGASHGRLRMNASGQRGEG
jgi:hypothetical protein